VKKKIMLLGSGELGREIVISVKRLGHYVLAVDSYAGAPAMQVADQSAVIDMLDGSELDRLVAKHLPDIIVPEIEAIRTERLYDYEKQGVQIVPSARAVNFTMNRRAIRDLAAKELGLPTARYAYAATLEELRASVDKLGLPCVVKPLMSSSGKGQSVVKNESDLAKAWESATTKGRGDISLAIVEEFIPFDFEITLLTVTQRSGVTLFCPPIEHRQERGDYQESWQPMPMSPTLLAEAQRQAAIVTKALGGSGIWGVEFFITPDKVYFSELSPRPHDTGMVTLSGSQNLSEFELHARAILGLPIPEVTLERVGASAVILADQQGGEPDYQGLEQALASPRTDVRIFGKPSTRPYRRMGVALTYDLLGTPFKETTQRAIEIAGAVKVVNRPSES